MVKPKTTRVANDSNNYSEARKERQWFKEIHSKLPHNDCVEAAMFPTLFPTGQGVYDQDRPKPLRFVEYRDHLLKLSDTRFRDSVEWKTWADAVVQAMEAKKQGKEDVFLELPSATTQMFDMQRKFQNLPLEDKLMNPCKLKKALECVVESNPAFAGQKVEDLMKERLTLARQMDGIIVRECAICHRFETPEGEDLKLLRCSKCQAAFYCGKEHQLDDWKRHKKECKKLAALKKNQPK